MTAGEFKDLFNEFYSAIDHEVYRSGYMKGCPPYNLSAAWHECFLAAIILLLKKDMSLRQAEILQSKRKEISLCKMFIKGHESNLNKQGKSIFPK